MAMIAAENKLKDHRTAWAEICVELHQPLLKRARRLTNNDLSLAEDLVHDVFVRVLTYAPNPEEITNHLSYLTKMIQNGYFDRLRERRSVVRTISLDDSSAGEELEPLLPIVEPTPFRNLENEELLSLLDPLLGDLSKRERFLFRMHLDGWSSDEIAAKLTEDVRVTRVDLNAILAKIRYRARTYQER